MIINIRGTSGSGKSHLMRSIMNLYAVRINVMEPDRKRPIGYLLTPVKGTGREKVLAVPGHYETACGGCDTVPSLDKIFSKVRDADQAGHDVLFEGLLVNSDRKRTIALQDEEHRDIHIITLNTTIDVCLASIMLRREARAEKSGKEPKPLNPKNTEAKYKLANTNHLKFLEAKMKSHLLNRDEAFNKIRELLKV